MSLSLQQINNLISGTSLAAELSASSPELRRFVDVRGYTYNERGKRQQLSKTISNDKKFSALFRIRDYAIPTVYIENGWDVTEDCCVNYICVDEITGISGVEIELSKHLSDFSILVPEWKCDNPL